jgi:hypothetical protein
MTDTIKIDDGPIDDALDSIERYANNARELTDDDDTNIDSELYRILDEVQVLREILAEQVAAGDAVYTAQAAKHEPCVQPILVGQPPREPRSLGMPIWLFLLICAAVVVGGYYTFQWIMR